MMRVVEISNPQIGRMTDANGLRKAETRNLATKLKVQDHQSIFEISKERNSSQLGFIRTGILGLIVKDSRTVPNDEGYHCIVIAKSRKLIA
jgi:hypothetical protein